MPERPQTSDAFLDHLSPSLQVAWRRRLFLALFFIVRVHFCNLQEDTRAPLIWVNETAYFVLAMSVKRLAMSRRPSGLDCRNTVPAEAERRSVHRLACASAVVGRCGGPATVEKPGHRGDDLGGRTA